MARSAVSFVRRQLKIKGTSEHSGRGFVMMGAKDPITYDELLEKTKALLPRWEKRGFVESFEECSPEEARTRFNTDRYFRVKFVEKEFGEYYRTWQVAEERGKFRQLGIVCM